MRDGHRDSGCRTTRRPRPGGPHLSDYAAGNSATGATDRLRHVIVTVRVDDEGGAVVVEQCGRSPLERHPRREEFRVRGAVHGNEEIRQIPAAESLGVEQAMLALVRVDVTLGGLEVRLALSHAVQVNAMGSRGQLVYLYEDQYTGWPLLQQRLADGSPDYIDDFGCCRVGGPAGNGASPMSAAHNPNTRVSMIVLSCSSADGGCHWLPDSTGIKARLRSSYRCCAD